MTGPRVVFDLDGTLIDSAPQIQQAVNLALAELDLAPLDLPRVTSFIGNGLPVLAQRAHGAAGVAESETDFEARILTHYNRISAETGRLFPGVRDALDQLRGDGARIGLCTNKPGDATVAVLKLLDLATTFEAVAGGDSLPQRKPDPAPLFHVLGQLGSGPAVYVGDSEVDAETAKRAGVPFALYTEGYRKTPVDQIPHDAAFSDFSRLVAVVQGLIS